MVAQREPYEFPAIRAFATELAAWRGTMSKVELAETLGYTPQLIGQLEAGKNIPSKKFAEDTDTLFKTNGLFVRLWKLVTDTRYLFATTRFPKVRRTGGPGQHDTALPTPTDHGTTPTRGVRPHDSAISPASGCGR